MKHLLLLPALCLALFAGCLKPDPNGSDNEGKEAPVPEDNDLRAGATSTTNWPPELGGNPVLVRIRADTALTLSFFRPGVFATDPESVPVALSGKVTLFKAGVIPALEKCPSVSMGFASVESLAVPIGLLDPLSNGSSDTVFFNIRTDADTLQAWKFGFGYAKKSRKFFKTSTSEKTGDQLYFRESNYSFKGFLDTAGWNSEPELSGNSFLSFYIPGSTFFWIPDIAEGDTLFLGPVPRGEFPLRLLRVTYGEGRYPGTEIEVFEVETAKAAFTDEILSIFKPGASVLRYRTESTISLRSDVTR